MGEKVLGEVHYYDCKGRNYKLDHLADELKGLGISVVGRGFNDDYDGYVDVEITKEQAILLDKKYRHFNIIGGGRGKTIEECFDNAVMTEKIIQENRKR